MKPLATAPVAFPSPPTPLPPSGRGGLCSPRPRAGEGPGERAGIALAACAFVLPLAEDSTAWLQLLPSGAFKPVDGRPMDVPHWHIDSASAPAVIARSKAQQTLAVIDYEHQTLNKHENGQPAPAAGWLLDFAWREGSGLWGQAFLTERARALIKAGEYRYFSPVFSYDPNSGQVLQIEMGALTNTPALDGMEPLARLEQLAAACFGFLHKGQAPEDRTMDKTLLAALGLKEDADEAAAIAALNQLKAQQAAQSQTLAALKVALKVTDETQLLAACSRLTAPPSPPAPLPQVGEGSHPDPAKFVPMEAVKDLAEKVAALSMQVSGSAVDKLVGDALADGRLLPAMEGWAREYGQKDRAGLQAFLTQAAPLAALTRLQAQNPPPADGLTLSSGERQAAQLLGLSAKDLAGAKGA